MIRYSCSAAVGSAVLVVLLASGCHTPAPPGRVEFGQPFVRVLGTAQDAGLPHFACTCRRCTAARVAPRHRRHVASLAVVVPHPRAAADVFIIDATPDIRAQLDMLADVRDAPPDSTDRNPVEGVFLTHAHMGHYLGLAYFGFESVNSRGVPVYCAGRMASFLETNGPWSQLVSMNNIDVRPTGLDQAVDLGGGVTVRSFQVPHRDEYSNTVGYIIRGPRSTVVYIPDTAPWMHWQTDVLAFIDALEGGVDVLLIDGTFYSGDELPGRDLARIGHPLMVDSMRLFSDHVIQDGLGVYFTHLNHSNPAIERGSPQHRAVQRRGFNVLEDGTEFGL